VRIIFMGTPDFAVASLEACLTLGEVVAVVTQPDKPRGRGNTVSFSPVKQFAATRGIKIFQPEKIRGTDFAQQMKSLNADVAVVTAYGKILPQDVLDAPRLGCVNVHASLLPRFRGAAPIQWAIASGDASTGVTLMKMDAGMDTGPVIAMLEMPIEKHHTSASLHDDLKQLGNRILCEYLPRYVAGQAKPVPQATVGMVMAPMIQKEDGQIDFTRKAIDIERRMRAFTPWPGCFTYFENALLKIHAAQVVPGISAVPGTVTHVSPAGITVACGEDGIKFEQLQPEGKRAMSAHEFLNGKKIEVGTTPFVFKVADKGSTS
jgi:methionyl-tRNA formyltransferase